MTLQPPPRIKALKMEFKTEKASEEYLSDMLELYFTLLPQCRLEHIETGQNLRIDFIAKPKSYVKFPLSLIGIEVKSGKYAGRPYADQVYNRALFQALDYTRCTFDDARVKRHAGARLRTVFLWPGLEGKNKNSIWGVNNLIGLGHVGVILRKHIDRFTYDHIKQTVRPAYELQFRMGNKLLWSPTRPARNARKIRHTLGSGVARIDAATL
jgi:hypothetical protein|tara:strand:- start:2231 stop:2863 length:633 start_codon:yes stop_codon:yes gene_type:complete